MTNFICDDCGEPINNANDINGRCATCDRISKEDRE
jgi:hypothetical protein